MVSITRDFAPPFRLIAPYFIIGCIFYLISNFLLFGFDITAIQTFQDMYIISWTHLFLLGFVMMIIFGAMAQLIPVVLERGHFSVDFYYIIWPLLCVGVGLMSYGFIYSHLVLSFGGMLVLLSMFIFSLEVFLTLKDVKTFDVVTISVIISNLFLIIGIVLGFMMALTFAGFMTTNIYALLKAHVYMIIGGYIFITIMSFSYILLPMFGLSHGFSRKPLDFAITTQTVSVLLVFISAVVDSNFLAKVGYLFSLISILSYFYLVFLINKTRARKQNDMYIISLFISFGFFALAVIFAALHVASSNDVYALLSGWLLMTGFIGFIISGHLYKIVPFLVWYERFSPLVGKQKVPMLGDMVPTKSANFQIIFTCIGIVLESCAIFFQNTDVHMAAASFLSIGALFLFSNLMFMIRYK